MAALAGAMTLALPTTGAAAAGREDDAGSGRDAGTTPETAVAIDLGVTYDAALVVHDRDPDDSQERWLTSDADHFLLDITDEVAVVELVTADPSPVHPDFDRWWCELFDASGARLNDGRDCERGRQITIERPGPHTLVVTGSDGVEHDYTLRVRGRSAAEQAEITERADEHAHLFVGRAPTMRPDPAAATVVVAVADSGVNPYHAAYRRPHLTAHPCTWVAGFDDCDVPALSLSLEGHDTWQEAFAADADVWASVIAEQWYWIPGTNIIGAVCDGTDSLQGDAARTAAGTTTHCIFDDDGHGTGTTSAVLSEAPEALLLVHDGSAAASAMASAPVVPDVQSHSWGPPVPLPLHAADPVLTTVFEDDAGLADQGARDRETLFFLAAGNEAPLPRLLDSRGVHPEIQIVGGGRPGRADLSSWTTQDFTSWMCRPVATHTSLTATKMSCGTSFAAPTVAGTAAAALLEVRRLEGHSGRSTSEGVSRDITRGAFLDAMRSAATYAPEDGYQRASTGEIPMPAGLEHVFWGHGWLDGRNADTIVACLIEANCPEISEDAARWNDLRMELRRRQTQPVADVPLDGATESSRRGGHLARRLR